MMNAIMRNNVNIPYYTLHSAKVPNYNIVNIKDQRIKDSCLNSRSLPFSVD